MTSSAWESACCGAAKLGSVRAALSCAREIGVLRSLGAIPAFTAAHVRMAETLRYEWTPARLSGRPQRPVVGNPSCPRIRGWPPRSRQPPGVRARLLGSRQPASQPLPQPGPNPFAHVYHLRAQRLDQLLAATASGTGPFAATGTTGRSAAATGTNPSIGTGAARSGLINSIGIGKTMVEFWFDPMSSSVCM